MDLLRFMIEGVQGEGLKGLRAVYCPDLLRAILVLPAPASPRPRSRVGFGSLADRRNVRIRMVPVDGNELGTEAEPTVDWVLEQAGNTEADAGR